MSKAVFISGYLHNLSDNIIPFLNKNTDLFVHTWQGNDNDRWIKKLERYKKYCGDFTLMTEKPKFERKRISYLYSTYAAIKMAKDIDKYNICIKFKPNLDAEEIEYSPDPFFHFKKAKLQSRPLLNDYKMDDCIYGTVHYKSIDERMFTAYPKTLKKIFHKPFNKFFEEITNIDKKLSEMMGENYEGSLLWTELFEKNNIPIIQDINLKLPNNRQWL